MDEVEDLIRVVLQALGSQMTRLALQLVVLVDDSVTEVPSRPCGHAERSDAEVVTDGPPPTAPVAGLVDVFKIRYRVVVHGTSFSSPMPDRLHVRRASVHSLIGRGLTPPGTGSSSSGGH
jgi:hypothetical protein